MCELLFLAHRIPYPPDKGDKIRAWNVLRHLASRHNVHLATFVDDPADLAGLPHLQEICASVLWRRLSPRVARLRSLPCLLTGAPLTQGYFSDGALRDAVSRIIRQRRPDLLYAFSSSMAPYVTNCRDANVVIDMVDVDSEKWRQYAQANSGLRRLIYAREGRALLRLERRAAAAADAAVFVSRSEAELFMRLAPESAEQTHWITNGVDAAYFDPAHDSANPFGDRVAIVFTGAMDYQPNIEAMTWFVGRVMPRLHNHPTRPILWIVGSNPVPSIRALAGANVCVTGRVADVRPYLRYARAVVAPLQIARGLQNKVLEAMAMAAAVVVTPQVRLGLDRCRDNELIVARTPTDFARLLSNLLDGGIGELGNRARARVIEDYDWPKNLNALDRLLDQLRHREPVRLDSSGRRTTAAQRDQAPGTSPDRVQTQLGHQIEGP